MNQLVLEETVHDQNIYFWGVMKTGVEAIHRIHYKLCMMGIPIDGATHIHGDSMSVVNNTLKPESLFKKKKNAVFYRSVIK